MLVARRLTRHRRRILPLQMRLLGRQLVCLVARYGLHPRGLLQKTRLDMALTIHSRCLRADSTFKYELGLTGRPLLTRNHSLLIENETVNYTHVEESDTTKFVNSSTYGKKFRGSRWSAEETELFFDVSLAIVSGIRRAHPDIMVLDRHSPNSARTMNLSLTFCLAAIVRPAKTSSKLKIGRIPIVSPIASITTFHMVRNTICISDIRYI
jgi:hypothetical protein